MKGPCAKQTVTATIIATNGKRFIGTNYCNNPQEVCPRDSAGMKTGEGYHLCKDVCQQSGHAEINAIAEASGSALGATLYLEGHYYACDDCAMAARSAGVKRVVIGSPPAETQSQQARSHGLPSLAYVARVTGTPVSTLKDWHRDRPERFRALLLGARVIFDTSA